MSPLELRHLRMIPAIVQSGSISKAALALGMSQPALSAQVQRIEQIFGARLFERDRTGSVPTELGRAIAARARAVLNDLDAMLGPDTTVRSTSEVLQVGSHPTSYMGQLMRELRAELGWSSVRIENQQSGQLLVEMLDAGQVHLVLAARSEHAPLVGGPKIQIHPLLTQPVFVAISETHRLAALDAVPLAELGDFEWVTPPPDDVLVNTGLHAAWSAAGITPSIRHYTTDTTATRSLVRAGAVSPIMPTFDGGRGVVVLPLAGDPITVEFVMAIRSDGPLVDRTTEIVRCVARVHYSLVDDNPHYRRWWDRNPWAHRSLDAAIADTSGKPSDNGPATTGFDIS